MKLKKDKKPDKRGTNPKSLANLRFFKPGVTSNPNGRPKKPVCVTTWLKEYAELKITEPIDTKSLTFGQAAALKFWQEAVKGDLNVYQFIVERIEGKAVERVEHSGEAGSPISHMISIQVVSEKAKELTEQIIQGAKTGNAT